MAVEPSATNDARPANGTLERHRVIVHSVINLTGASRFLLEDIVPRVGDELVLWVAHDSVLPCAATPLLAGRANHRSRVAALLWRARAMIAQMLFVLSHRNQVASLEINSVSNIGAIVASRFLPPRTPCRLYAHESPCGKWRLPYVLVRRWFRGDVHTVSVYMQAELRRIGIRASWRYPRLRTCEEHTPTPRYDVMFIAHPDRSKGYELVQQVLAQLPEAVSAILYLSSPPNCPLQPKHNVEIVIGRALTRQDYCARLCVQATDPAFVKETFGYIVADSLSAGVPVVCAPSGGISEQLIHGFNAYFVKSYSPGAFTEAIVGLLDSPAALATLAAGARVTQRWASREPCNVD